MNLTDYKFTEELYNVASNVANYTSTLSTSFSNAAYNFNYSGIPATAENFVFNDAPAVIDSAAEYVKLNAFNIKENLAQKAALAIKSAADFEFVSESTKSNVAEVAAKVSEFNTNAYNFVTEDAPEAIYGSAANAVNHVYAAGSYISDNLVSARDTVANKAQENVDTAYTTAQSITEQCNANEICANAIEAAPYVAAGVAALAAVGVAYKLYGYMQATEAQDSLIDIAAHEAEPEVVKHVCKNHDHHHAETTEIPASPKLTVA